MAKKKIRAPFYTEKKLGIQSLFNDTRLPNGWLYAGGKHPTRITAKDLPDTYLPQMVYKVNGYIRLDGIVDVVYKPNYHINHLHKDDFLYISYTTPIQSEKDNTGRTQYYNYDALLWGANIVEFIQEVQKRGTYDMSRIAEEVKAKERFFIRKYPEECNRFFPPYLLLTQEEYDQAMHQEQE